MAGLKVDRFYHFLLFPVFLLLWRHVDNGSFGLLENIALLLAQGNALNHFKLLPSSFCTLRFPGWPGFDRQHRTQF